MDAASRLRLYLEHRRSLVRYVASMVGGTAQAEDVVQDAWLRFANERLSDIERPLPYLYRIVRNLALDTQRQYERQPWVSDGHALDGLSCDLSSPERQLHGHYELRQLEHALCKLPARTRRAFELHRLGGLSYQAIAEALGISAGLAHQLVREALVHCMEALDDD
ncbi:sigma-70 family RNA polymerase sigma factor [Pseudomonas sp. DC3000-4b1]|uniref:sigma-70 family RNA polymerase sigma factor n=1 Tax=unclassified Pseudomonas TaxID=196821 RepID=UPI003CEA14E2